MAAPAAKKTNTQGLMRKTKRMGNLHAMTHAKNATTTSKTRALSGGVMAVVTAFARFVDLVQLLTTFTNAREHARASITTARE